MKKIEAENAHKLFSKVYMKYQLIKVRHKMAYQALRQRVSVPELLFNQCLKSYNEFILEGHIAQTSPEILEREIHLYYDLVCGLDVSQYLAKIIQHNELKQLTEEDKLVL